MCNTRPPTPTGLRRGSARSGTPSAHTLQFVNVFILGAGKEMSLKILTPTPSHPCEEIEKVLLSTGKGFQDHNFLKISVIVNYFFQVEPGLGTIVAYA